jgi:hypothetical protein
MCSLIRRLWRDDAGAVLATEWVFMATILIIGVIPGMVALRHSLNVAMLRSACQLNSSSCACSGSIADIPADDNVAINQAPCD